MNVAGGVEFGRAPRVVVREPNCELRSGRDDLAARDHALRGEAERIAVRLPIAISTTCSPGLSLWTSWPA